MRFVQIPKNWYTSLNDIELSLASAVVYICYPYENETTISYNIIKETMFGDHEPSEHIHKQLVKSLKELVDIGFLDGSRKNRFSYTITTHRPNNEPFAQVPFESLQKLFVTENFNLVRHFICMVGSRNSAIEGGKIGNQTIEAFANWEECSGRTILRHNKQLEDLHLIYIRRAGKVTKQTDGAIIQQTNVYGLWEDKAVIDTYANKIMSKSSESKKLGIQLSYLRKGKEYNLDEVQAMYDYAVDHNTAIMLKRCVGVMIDMTVFDKYDIKRNEDYELFA